MPKETIARLLEDSVRVLMAGAKLASGDPALAKDRDALRGLAKQLGDKAPVIGQLADAADLAAQGKDPADLVSLVAKAAQVRAAQADLAPAGAGGPLPPGLPVGTPCSGLHVYELRQALTESGGGQREERIRGALARGDVADLRLVDAVVEALGDSYFGSLVEKEVVPQFGPALAGPLRAAFKPKGGAPDGRRLGALVRIDPAGALATLKSAIKDGSSEVRTAAFDLVGEHYPGHPDFEAAVFEAARKDRSGDVREAAVIALHGYPSDAALDVLIGLLEDKHLDSAAIEAARASKHPGVVARVLPKLDAALAELAKKKPKKERETDVQKAQTYLYVMASRPHPEVEKRAVANLELLGKPAAEAASHSADRAVLVRLADLLAGDHEELFGPAVQAARKLGPQEAYRRLRGVFDMKDRSTDLGQKRLAAALAAVAEDRDPKWTDFLLDVLREDLKRDKPGPTGEQVTRALADLKDPKAVKPLIKMLGAAPPRLRTVLVEALGKLGDASAIPALLDLVGKELDWTLTYQLTQSLYELGDPSVVGRVRKLIVKFNEGTNTRMFGDNLLHALEQRFPGA